MNAGEPSTIGELKVIQVTDMYGTVTAHAVAAAAAPGVHVYEGTPDSRQSDNVALPTSRFRPRYRALTTDEKALHDAIKSKAAELEALFELIPAGRYRALGLTDLESSVMWVVKQLTA